VQRDRLIRECRSKIEKIAELKASIDSTNAKRREEASKIAKDTKAKIKEI
jgi:hypothetical protein